MFQSLATLEYTLAATLNNPLQHHSDCFVLEDVLKVIIDRRSRPEFHSLPCTHKSIVASFQSACAP